MTPISDKPMICKSCSLTKESHLASLKKILTQAGLHVTQPLFHGTKLSNAMKIAKEGFKARAGGPGNDSYYDNAVSFTRDLQYAKSFGETGSSDVIFIVDENQLKNKFKTYAYDYNEVNKTDRYDPTQYKRKNPKEYESETRVSLSPGKFKPTDKLQEEAPPDDMLVAETNVSPRYIKAILIRQSVAKHEILKLADQMGVPVVLYNGNKYLLRQTQQQDKAAHNNRIFKTRNITKQAEYFSLKQVLKQTGVNIEYPVFHSTDKYSAKIILKGGLKARSAGDDRGDAHQENAICFTRNLCYTFNRWAAMVGAEVVFVLDLNQLKNIFKTYSKDWYAMDTLNTIVNNRLTGEDRVPLKSHVDKNKEFEYEERVSRSPKTVRNLAEPETVIPPKYIKAIIISNSRYNNSNRVLYKTYGNEYPFIIRYAKNKYEFVTSETQLMDVKVQSEMGENFLLSAINGDRMALVKALDNMNLSGNPANYKFDKDYIDEALIEVVKNGHFNLIRLLIIVGRANVNTQNGLPLILAVENNSLTAVKLLIDEGADVHAADEKALKKAHEYNHVDIVDLLIAHGADPTALE